MAGFISDAVREQIRAANDITDVIGAVLPLKRAGGSFVALCPFHKEKSPSFHVNPRKQTFHCFACHKGGDVFTFVREYESLDFVAAVKRLAERAGIALQYENDPEYKEKQFLKDKLLEIHEQITQRWHHCLLNDAAAQRARDYLRERGVSPEAVKLFRLGYAPEAWDDPVNWAKSKAFDLAQVEQCGLILRKEGSDHYYARFRGRLMFPISDEQGRVIGFSGRILPGDDDPRKYVNSPETPLFTKSRVMFGLDKSKRAILDKKFAIVCEGQLDLISCFMAGVQNIVAPQGTALTAEHSRILKRFADEVVLCFDSDRAGQQAAVRVLDDLIGSGLAIRVATIPAPHDPDTYIKEFGGEAFQKLIDRAEAFFDFYLGYLCATNDVLSDRGQQAVIRGMADAVGKTGDQTLLDKYSRKTAARLALSPTSALGIFKKALARPAASAREQEEPWIPPEEEPIPMPSTHEAWLLRLVLSQDDVLDWTRAHLDSAWLQHPVVRTIIAHRLAFDEEGHPVQPVQILSELEDPAAQALITESLAEARPIPRPEQQVIDLVTRLRNNYIEKQLAGILQQLGRSNLAPDEAAALLKEQSDLRTLKRTRIGAS